MADFTPTPSTDPAELQAKAAENWQQFKQQPPSTEPPKGGAAFLARVRMQYPQYDHVDDVTLATKLVQKYPQYAAHLQDIVQTVTPPPPELEEEVQREKTPQGDVEPISTAADVVQGAFMGGLTGGPFGAVKGAAEAGIRSALTQKVGAVGARTGAQVGERIGGAPGRTAGAVIGGIATPMLAGGAVGGVGKSLRGESEMADVVRAAEMEGEQVAEKAGEQLTEHQRNLQTAIDKAHVDANQSLIKTQDRLASEATSEAQQAAIKGVTPSAPAEVFEPGAKLLTEESALREVTMYERLTAPVRRIADAWAEKRNNLLGPLMEEPIQAPSIGGAVQRQRLWLAEHNRSVSGPVESLMNEATELTTLAPGTAAQQPQMVTVAKLLGLQSKAKLLGRTLKAPTDRAVAHDISDAVDGALSSIDAPNLGPLNAQYRSFRNRFPGNWSLLMGDPSDTASTAKQIFGDMRTARNLVAEANPEELGTLREIYGNAALQNRNFIKPEHAEVVNQLFRGTQFQTPEGFARLLTKEASFEELMQLSPAVGERVAATMLDAAQAQQTEIAKQIARDGIAEARRMGPLGKQILDRIEAASGSPRRQAEIATQGILGMSMEEAGKISIAETAKKAKLVGPAPTTPSELATRTIQSEPNLAAGRFNWLAQRFPLYATYTGLQASGLAAGAAHPSPYITAMAILGGVLNVRKYFRAAFVNAMKDPQKAAAFVKAVETPEAPGAMNAIGREMHKAFTQLSPFGYGSAMAGAEQAGRKAQEPEELPEQTTTTPMQQTYYRASAQQSLGGPDAHTEDVNRLAKTHQQLQSGKTPDVQQDLRSGRMSVPALKETLTKVNQSNAPGLLQYMGPDDAMHMLQVASPQEKQWLEPLVRQKLQQAVQNPKTAPWMKQQAQQMLASLGQ